MNGDATNSPTPLLAARLGDVSLALIRNRYALRRTAKRAGDQRLAQRLRRFARRRQATARDLERMGTEVEPPDEPLSAVPALRGEAVRAFETSAFATAAATNRRLRVAVERALESNPPDKIRSRLERLREDADREASVLNARLSELTQSAPDIGAT